MLTDNQRVALEITHMQWRKKKKQQKVPFLENKKGIFFFF